MTHQDFGDWVDEQEQLLYEQKIIQEYVQSLDEASALDKAAAIYLLTRINKDFREWDAYKLGIIDDKGAILKDPETQEEKNSFGGFDKLILRIKVALGSQLTSVLSGIGIWSILIDSLELPEIPRDKVTQDHIDALIEGLNSR